MNKQIKKQIEAELLAAASEVLKRHHQSKAGKVKKLLKHSGKKILKKISKDSKAKDGKAPARKSKGSVAKIKSKKNR